MATGDPGRQPTIPPGCAVPLVVLLALPIALFGASSARAGTEPSCVEVVNNTPYWMPGAARSPGAREVGFRLAAGESNRFCLEGEAARITTIEIIIKSGWGLPIGSCRMYDGGKMEIVRQKTDDGERTRLNCR